MRMTADTLVEAERLLTNNAPADEFLQFVRALVEADALTTDVRGDFSEVVYFLEKPWKWATEFVAWDEAGRPMDDSMPGWEAFTIAVGP
jgi:hypothetical protein